MAWVTLEPSTDAPVVVRPLVDSNRASALVGMAPELWKGIAPTQLAISQAPLWGRGRVIGCFRISAISDPVGVGSLPENIAKVLRKPDAKRSKKERDVLQKHYLASAPEIRKLDSEL